MLARRLTARLARRASAAAADDAASICNAAISAYGAAATSGDPEKMAAVFAADGELVSPWGVSKGHDELVKTYASFMKPATRMPTP